MSDDNKKDDLLKELEIQSILDESRSLADQEQMKKNAQKYRAKPKMKDIYSNADQKPRLKNSNPLDIDGGDKEEIKADTTNTIVGEKTALQLKLSKMNKLLVGSDDAICADNLSMKVDELVNVLNERLKKYSRKEN